MYTLHDYFRSTASYRVRIVLNLKNIAYKSKEVHLVNDGGEQFSEHYSKLNPQQLVPTLVDNQNSLILTQSLAIIDYLESKHQSPSIYAMDLALTAQIKSIAQLICCDIHPLNNLRVLTYLDKNLSFNETQKLDWYHHWLDCGFAALEKKLSTIARSKPFCFADKVTLADVCLIPQMYNAKRFNLNLSHYPLLSEIDDHCLTLAPFIKAMP